MEKVVGPYYRTPWGWRTRGVRPSRSLCDYHLNRLYMIPKRVRRIWGVVTDEPTEGAVRLHWHGPTGFWRTRPDWRGIAVFGMPSGLDKTKIHYGWVEYEEGK